MNKKEERKALTNLTREVDEAQALLYLYSYSKQGQFLQWDAMMDMDTLWKEQLYVINPNLLAFRINATHDVQPTPANLHLWKKTDSHGVTYAPLRREPYTIYLTIVRSHWSKEDILGGMTKF